MINKSILFVLVCLISPAIITYASASNEVKEVKYEVKAAEFSFVLNNQSADDFPVLDVNGVNYLSVDYMLNLYGFKLENNEKQSDNIRLVTGLDENWKEINRRAVDFVKGAKDAMRTAKESNRELEGFPLLDIDGRKFIKLQHAVNMFEYNIYSFSLNINENTKTININVSAADCPDSFLFKEKQTDMQDYLKGNAIPLSVGQTGEREVLKDIGFEQYSIFLAGESHGVAKNYDLWLHLIKHLYESEGVQYIIIESGYCAAQLLNRYIQTGDLDILHNVMSNLKGNSSYSINASRFYMDLYEYNKTLPEDKKLTLIGVDIEHQTRTGISYLLSLVTDITKVPEIIQNDIKELDTIKKLQVYKLDKFQSIYKSLTDNQNIYIEYFQENYECFQNGLSNIIKKLECDYTEDILESMRLREKFMIDNFIYQYEKLGNAKCFGSLGGFHAQLSKRIGEEGGEYNFATYLNERYKKTKGKTAVFKVDYYNCSSMNSVTGGSDRLANSTLAQMLSEITNNDFTLFKLDKEGSVFCNNSGVIFQQYLLYIRDSRATELYNISALITAS